jgi:hypothetical protein
MAQRDQKPDLASALYPALSAAARAKAAREVKAREELKTRNRRLADRLQATIDAVRRDRER